ncbi:cupin domain-containing protein [Saccharopolyspora sp. NPDC049357]|uniref:cupin domain-containing protein n=1 Tax=Saccharopolyspora sp. NPDC049357 TaxID=3154507 RepID=UPI00343693E6
MAENIPLADVLVTPAPHTRRFRRLVTGVDGEGRSVFADDALSPHRQVVADCPGFVVTDFWRHDSVPVDNSGEPQDGLTGPFEISPPPAGSVFRVVEFPPDTEWAVDEETRTRLFHSTASLDYAIVLGGEIWAVLDEEEQRMTAGDVLVQRGTSHLWSNRSTAPCTVMFVLVGGTIA